MMFVGADWRKNKRTDPSNHMITLRSQRLLADCDLEVGLHEIADCREICRPNREVLLGVSSE